MTFSANFVFAISILNSSAQSTLISNKPHVAEPTQIMIEAIHAGVRDALNDPDSAKFGKILSSKTNESSYTICGLVNAKNKFGGYVGMTPFIGLLFKLDDGSLKFIVIGGISSTSVSVKVTNDMCKENGLFL